MLAQLIEVVDAKSMNVVTIPERQISANIFYPFADQMDPISTEPPTQSEFDALRQIYNAGPHPDFDVKHGFDRSARELPFQLALGLHIAGPRVLDSEATLTTFNAYMQRRPLIEQDGSVRRRTAAQRERVQSVIAAAVLSNEINYHYMNANPSEALTFLKTEGLLSRRKIAGIKAAMKLVDVRLLH